MQGSSWLSMLCVGDIEGIMRERFPRVSMETDDFIMFYSYIVYRIVG